MRSTLLAALILTASAGTAFAQTAGDPAAGKAAFDLRCSICHKAEKGAANGVGPALYGAYGRKAGQAPGFAYSPQLLAANLTWTPENLDKWTTDPQKMIPGVKMVIAPINNPADRANLIAYLKTQSDAPAAKAPAKKAPAKKKS